MSTASYQETISRLINIVSAVTKLKEEDIDIHENLVETGIDSIVFTKIKAALIRHFTVDISFSQLYEELTDLHHIALHIVNTSRDHLQVSDPKPGPAAVKAYAEISAAAACDQPKGLVSAHEDTVHQRREQIKMLAFEAANRSVYNTSKLPLSQEQVNILVQGEMSGSGAAFNEALAFRITGNVRPDLLQESIQRIVGRHEALRSTIDAKHRTQTVHQTIAAQVETLTARDQAHCNNLLHEVIRKEFDLSGPLFRAAFIREKDAVSVFVFVIHHLIADGWSIGVLFNELIEIYNSLCHGTNPLLETPVPFRHYPIIRQEWMGAYQRDGSQPLEENGRLSSISPYMDVATDFHVRTKQYTGGRLEFSEPGQTLQALRRVSAQDRTSLFNTMTSVFLAFLHKITGNRDISFGVPFAGQNLIGAEALVGNCVEMIGIRTSVEASDNLKLLSDKVQETVRLIEEVGYFHQKHAEQSYNVVFNLIRGLSNETFHQTEMEYVPLPIAGSKYDLFVSLFEFRNELIIRFDYNKGLLSEDTVSRWAAYFKQLVKARISNSVEPVTELAMVPSEEIERILEHYTDMKHDDICTQLKLNPADYGILPGSDAKAFVLDREMRHAGIGIAGEIYVGPTELEFYHTNLRGRWLENGELQVLGEEEQELWIKGRRVSLHVIEESLRSISLIAQASCQYVEAQSELLAYVVSEQQLTDAGEIVSALRGTLPSYMIPVQFIQVDDIESRANPRTIGYDSQLTQTEQQVLRHWKEILNVSTAGIEDDFFHLGGNSIKAMRLAAVIQQEFKINIQIKSLFEQPTVKHLSALLDSATPVERGMPGRADLPSEHRDHYPASSAQKRLYALHQLQPESLNYNLVAMIEIEGSLNVRALENALNQVIDKQESLRTYFAEANGTVLQKIAPDFRLPLLMEEKPANKEAKRYIQEQAANWVRPFDLNRFPLLRVKLLKLEETRHVLLVNTHHIVFDGASADIFAQDLLSAYEGSQLPSLHVSYKDYVYECEQYRSEEETRKQEQYWLGVFQDELPVLQLRTDFRRPSIQTFNGSHLSFSFSEEISREVNRLCREHHVTPYMFFLACITLLLSKYTGQEDIVIGTATWGRKHIDHQDIIGMFVNTIPMRNAPVSMKTWSQFLQEVKINTLNALEHAEYPFEDLLNLLQVPRDISRNPLFDVLFTYQNRQQTRVQGSTIDLRCQEIKTESSKADLFFEVYEEETYLCNIEFNTDLFQLDTMERMALHWRNLVEQLVQHAGSKLHELEMIGVEERHELLYGRNNTRVSYPENRTIHQLFEEQARRTPDRIAVAYENVQLSYRQLEERSNQLASWLRSQGVQAETIVGIMLERSVEMIVAILAVLKAGGAYLPIDIKLPKDRIDYMLQDSKLGFLITTGELSSSASFAGITVDVHDEQISGWSIAPLEAINQSRDLAYIIYTSGTTGNPKGVMVEHNQVVRLLFNDDMPFDFTENDVWTNFHSICFDFSVWEMYGALLYGGKLVIVPESATQDFESYLALLKKERVTVLNQTPSAFYNLLNLEVQTADEQLQLRYIIFGGEALKPRMLHPWKEKYPNTLLINMYGITETTVHVTYKEIGLQEITSGISNIGKAIPTLTTYVMDEHLKIQPVGVPGELCVGGEGVARGYLHRDELTQMRFVDHPYKERERIYRSGDLVRMLPSGEMEYLGRIDHQVKIRGFRIELGEIENRLLSHPHIEDAVVLAKEDKHQQTYLCAYLVSHAEVDLPGIKAHLKQALPDYMIPSYFVQLDVLPLTSNGKINRNVLPEPDVRMLVTTAYEAPHNALQQKLASIWSESLDVENVGINDNFFELGGHSLKATAVISNIHNAFKVKIPLKQLFQKPTIRELSALIESSSQADDAPIEPCKEQDVYETSSIQKRLYSVQQRDPLSTAYNMPGVFQLREDADPARIERALQKLVSRHEALRTSFVTQNGEIMQHIESSVAWQLTVREEHESGSGAAALHFIRPFDLNQAPLFRAEFVKSSQGEHYLLIDMHHIICDGLSLQIFMDELAQLYKGTELHALRIQYKDYAAWQNQRLGTEEMKAMESYWLHEFQDNVPVLQLPYDYARPAVQSFDGSTISFHIEEPATQQLRQLAKDQDCTLHLVLLSAFYILLAKYSGQEDIVIGVPAAGRTRAELQPVMGMFINTLALRNRPHGDKHFIDFLHEVKDNSLQAYEHESYPFDLLLEKLNLTRDRSRNPLFDVMFDMYSVHTPEQANSGSSGLILKPCKMNSPIAKFDLNLHVLETGSGLEVSLEFCTKLFQEQTAERMAEHYSEILRHIGRNSSPRISQIEMIGLAEKKTILQQFSGFEPDRSSKRMIHERFEEQASRTPDQIAVISGENRLTYQELNVKANRLAHRLQSQGVGPNTLVGVCLERSVELAAALLSVLKAGGAYVPLDPALPQERLGYMTERAGLKTIVTTTDWAAKLPQTEDLRIVCLDDAEIGLDKEPEHNPCSEATDEHLMYVIYTSGSTGKPKGASVFRSGFANLLHWYTGEFGMSESDRLLLISSPSFDLTQKSLFAPLVTGGQLVLLSSGPYVASEVVSLVKRHNITLINGTPIAFYPLLDETAVEDYRSLGSLRYVFLGGEPIAADKLVPWAASALCRAEVVNTYGPTECTDVTVYSRLTDLPALAGKPVPIGRPVPGTRTYLVNPELGLVPIGLPGELCIAGVQVGGGYIGDPELTAEKFVVNPYGEDRASVLYRTGDLARYMPDGTIEYLGRIDHQVKLRGYRIEPAEIEAALREVENVRDAYVMVSGDQPEHELLIAYVVADIQDAAKELHLGKWRAQWRNELRQKLPVYMVPSAFVILEQFPLSPNGKIDRKSLPAPDIHAMTESEYEAPRNEAEERLVEVCSDVLRAKSVGISANFFDLGGDSIKAIRIVSKLQKYGYKLDVKQIFEDGTLGALAAKMKKNELSVNQETVVGQAELIPIQRMFFDRDLTDRHHWNQAVMLFSQNQFQELAIRQVFRQLVIHHDALRMVYRRDDERIVQYNRGIGEDSSLFALRMYDYRGQDDYELQIQTVCNKLQSSINLEEGPLVQLGLFRTDEGDHLLIAIHHLVIDGVSWRILLEDFTVGYRQVMNGEAITFQEKTNSFQEWGSYLQEQLDAPSWQEELAYWSQVEKADILPLPFDSIGSEEDNKLKYAHDIQVQFSKEESEDLLKHVNGAYNTDINDLLLTALGLCVRDWTSEEQILINLEGHGREIQGRVGPVSRLNVSRTIGWFTAQYPLVLTMKEQELSESIMQVKETLRRVPNKGVGFGILRYMDGSRAWKLAEPQISFNYLGQFDGELNNDLFELSRLSPGNSMSLEGERVHEIDINGMMAGQQLSFTFSYNTRRYNESTMLQLGSGFKNRLLEIIYHCKRQASPQYTPSDFSDPSLTWDELRMLQKKYEVDNRLKIADVYPLSPMQEGMLFLSLLDRRSAAYFEQTSYMIHGQLDLELVGKSFSKLVERYDLLRSVFVHLRLERPRQLVLAERQTNVYFEDLSHLNEEARQERIRQFELEDRTNVFSLSEDLLFRLSVLRLASQQYKVIWSSHHVLIDGWSTWILLKEFFDLYAKLKHGEPLPVLKPKRHVEYIRWLKRQDHAKAKAYWESCLEAYESTAKLPESGKSGGSEYVWGRLDFQIGSVQTELLQQIAQRTQTTMNTIIQAVWGVLLQKLNYSSDVVFGCVVSGRNAGLDGVDEIVGLLINTIPVRVQSSTESRFVDLLQAVQQQALQSAEFDYYPLAEIQAASALKDKLIHNKITFQNYYVDESFRSADFREKLGFSVQDFDGHEQTNFDFNVKIIPSEKLDVSFTYNEAVYSLEDVEAIQRYFTHVIETVAAHAEIQVSELELPNEKEKQFILHNFNETKVNYPQDLTFTQLFEAQAATKPDQLAVVFGSRQLTYRELNEKSNQLARTLRTRGAGVDTIVGLMAEPSLELIIGILGILKSGAAYLPIDPNHPGERIDFMLADAAVQILVTAGVDANRHTGFGGLVLHLNDPNLLSGDSGNPEMVHHPSSLAYVIYTSGTTGQSKGVQIQHSSLVNYCFGMIEKAEIRQDDSTALLSSYAFDLGYTAIYTALVSGIPLHMLTEETYKDPNALVSYAAEHCTYVKMTPSLFHLLLQGEGVERLAEKSRLRLIILGGEPVSLKDIEQMYEFDRLGRIQLMNHYGPTEATIGCVAGMIPRKPSERIRGVIGKPLPNQQVYIVDPHGKLLPVGVAGELCVAGAGLARSYLNRNELSAAKFTDHPFVPGERMYRTGDLAKWTANGEIIFLGRIDNQVKIRGYRIEPEEIEAKLQQHPQVKEAAVLCRESAKGEKVLAAYAVGNGDVTALELRSYLKENLPSYMVPSTVTLLERMPLTRNGKLNRSALPEPDLSGTVEGEYEAPRTETEAKLAEVWREVLSVERVGIRDSFFDLGGHSLKATVLISKIHKELNVEVPLKELFQGQTIEAMSRYIENSEQNLYKSIPPCDPQPFYETSSAQRRMYLIQQLEQGTVYNMPVMLEVGGELDAQRIEEAFQALVRRHEALRTSFHSLDGRIVQRIQPEIEFKLERQLNVEQDLEAGFQAFVRPFDMEKAPLFRAALVTSGGRTYLWADMHHIISDGVSIRLLMKQFLDVCHGKPLEPLRIQYKDFAAWQNKLFQFDAMRKQEAYWVGQFQDELPVLSLPYDFKRPAMQSFEGSVLNYSLDETLTEGLRELARTTGATLQMVLLSAFYILLSKYSGQEDIIIGIPVAGRPHADLQNLIGMFVNTLPLRNKPAGELRFIEFLEQVKEHSLLAYENQNYPFEELLEQVEVKRDLGRNPLFDVMFSMSYDDAVRAAAASGASLKLVPVDGGISKFDVSLLAVEQEKTIQYNIEYCTRLFRADTVNRIGLAYKELLSRLIRNPEEQLSGIDVMTQAEQYLLRHVFNDTEMDYPREKMLQQLFEEQAEAEPNRVAVVFDDTSLTYRELNEKANRLARVLQSEGVSAETRVGLLIERSLEMIVGVLAILKAGGAYVPIDPSHPKERIAYMLEDAQIRVLATSDKLASGLIGNASEKADEKAAGDLPGRLVFTGRVLDISDAALYEGPGESGNLDFQKSSDQLAYILYTSGSTGNPKGVMVEHRQVNNFIHAIVRATELDRCDSILCLTTISFDIFGLETLVPLTHGMKVVLTSEEEGNDGAALAALLAKQQVQTMQTTPSRFKLLLEEPAFAQALSGLDTVLVGGEELPAALWQQLRSYEQLNVYNVYGPTETTIWSTAKHMRGEEVGLTIGGPIGNTHIFMMDRHGGLAPIGVPGELCIAGEGVARGYWGREELTAEKFGKHPFVEGQRMYRTGDLARWLPNGEIEFLGRIDNQVKIRGHRIELGEIETRLARHDAVKEAVVIAREVEGQQELCAYVVGREGAAIDQTELKRHLKEGLPAYMIPSWFVELDSIPLTNNGKVNRKALPAPDPVSRAGGEYEAPRNETEETLARIWSQVLHAEAVGVHDHFFDLGGHSLKATVMAGEIHKQLQVKIPLRELFQRPTIRELGEYIEQSLTRDVTGSGLTRNGFARIERCEEQACYEASSAQKRMYTVQQLDKQSTAYNMPGVYELEGKVDPARIEAALQALVQRHEVLRTSFAIQDGEIVQRVEAELILKLSLQVDEGLSIKKAAARFVQPFDLEQAPLLRAELTRSEGKTYLLIDMHHIIADGFSVSILMKEFVMLYNGEQLEEPRLQYKDFAAWHNKQLRSGELEKEEAYWLREFGDGVPALTLRHDYERKAVPGFEGEKIRFALGEEATRGLRTVAKEHESTMTMMLLSVFTILLSKYSGQEDIVVGMPVAGRSHADLQPVVGMFVNTLALRTRPQGGITYRAYLEQVRNTALRAYDHQNFQLEELIDKLNVRREPGRNPLFDVMLDMSGLEEVPAIALDGLLLKHVRTDSNISKFDLTLKAYETESGIEMTFEYATSLFKKETIGRAIEHVRLISDEIVKNPDTLLNQISLFNQTEQEAMAAIQGEVQQLRSSSFSF
ncbi:non-ribosomal peptide synthetase [Paenibacillus puerhi]|uniref:non-ribosomal peptide synthetase n=1 Tax=Paenibacillus puerhi TaxID=2692622 RepID=UPI001359C7A2|nr:non-ribosomal peptide synthetase [Paenibacillus puerhi]